MEETTRKDEFLSGLAAVFGIMVYLACVYSELPGALSVGAAVVGAVTFFVLGRLIRSIAQW